ncbi:MAG: hypothetical protein WA197_25465 [Candidatus Acidiferrales bacterium]
MFSRRRLYLLVAGLLAVSVWGASASANSATLKCNSQRDQIWVYDSLSDFDVAAKLNCGEAVEVVGRVDGYAKIRAQNGTQGYVPESAFIDLPPLGIRPDPTHDVGLVAKQVQAKEIARAAAKDAFPLSVDSSRSGAAPGSVSISATPAKTTRETKPAASDSAASFSAYAEMNPTPASPPTDEASSNDIAEKASTRPTVSAPSTSSRNSIVDATAATVVNPPASATLPRRDSDEIPDLHPGNESADVACQKYFSAYGLTPSQMKWIAQNRKRLFSNVCPAPDPSKVDFVIIFTHDVDFFSETMPEPVHKSNGFSDFTPMTPIDTALAPESEADKAHREYVWIFQFAEGTFDPASFSPERRYQFSRMETSSLGSKGSLKAIEDAFRFVAAANR